MFLWWSRVQQHVQQSPWRQADLDSFEGRCDNPGSRCKRVALLTNSQRWRKDVSGWRRGRRSERGPGPGRWLILRERHEIASIHLCQCGGGARSPGLTRPSLEMTSPFRNIGTAFSILRFPLSPRRSFVFGQRTSRAASGRRGRGWGPRAGQLDRWLGLHPGLWMGVGGGKRPRYRPGAMPPSRVAGHTCTHTTVARPAPVPPWPDRSVPQRLSLTMQLMLKSNQINCTVTPSLFEQLKFYAKRLLQCWINVCDIVPALY